MHDSDQVAGPTGSGLLAAVRIDLRRLHETWMALAFPRQRNYHGTALGKWRPSTTTERASYAAWAALGLLVVAVGYPLLLVGFAARFYARRFDSAATRLGVLGVVVVSVVAWGLLSLLARLRFSPEGFAAVLAASAVATVSSALAVLAKRAGGRAVTVFAAYPFGVTALFLPPVVAALYSPTLAGVVFPGSQNLAVWLLDTVLVLGGVNEVLRASFDLTEATYPLMWFGLAIPVGWFLGLTVTLADVVRGDRSETTTSSGL